MAKKHVYGLTVKIGGDTSELGKALEGVNERSKDISGELKQINKLLKMDPGNTELLAQKQQVLTEAVATTALKLNKLKEAEKQVQKQFERGEVSEAQVRALQREIIETERKMKSYSQAAEDTTDQTKDLGEAAEDAEEKTGKLGDTLKTVGGVAAKGFAVVTGVVAAAGAALVAAAEESREYRREMGKLDTAFTTAGHSSEAATNTYKALQGVLGETDQAVEAANHLAKLAKSEQDLEKWTNICTGVYATFGASLPIEGLTEAANETAKVGKVTGPLADALNWAGVSEDAFNESLEACSNEAERQALIMNTLNGLYDDAATKYQETNAEVIRANQANEEWAAVMAEVGGAVEPILTDVKLLGASLLSDLLPGVKEVTGAFRALLNGEEGAEAGLGQAVGDLLGSIVEKAAELIPAIVEVGISLVLSLAGAIVAEIPNLVTTLLQVLIDSTPQLFEGWVSLLLSILDAIPVVILAIIDAAPDLLLAVIDGMLPASGAFLEGVLQLLMAIVDAIPIIIGRLLPEVPTIVNAIITGLLNMLPKLTDGAVKLLFGILDAIPEITAALVEETPNIVASIVEGLLSAIPELYDAGWELLSGLVKGMMDFDILGAVKGIGDSVVSGFKKAFDIHSPSRVMAGIGEMLDEGLAVGIEDNADAPVRALDNMTDDMLTGAESLNGLALERRVVHTFNGTPATPADGLSAKLDQILAAIKSGQVIMLDGKTLVGSTAARYDSELGQRRVLTERGAI